MQQYLVPTPDGEQPDLELVALVVDGEIIPASDVTNPASFTIVTVAQDEQQSEETNA